MLERLLDEMIKRSQLPLLVHAVSWGVQGKMDLHSAVRGAEVASSDMEATHQGESCRAAEDVVSPGGLIGPLCNACGNACRLAPCGSSSTQVGPAMSLDELLQRWEVRGVSIDVTDQEGRAMSLPWDPLCP